jgi:hypothetical protein
VQGEVRERFAGALERRIPREELLGKVSGDGGHVRIGPFAIARPPPAPEHYIAARYRIQSSSIFQIGS